MTKKLTVKPLANLSNKKATALIHKVQKMVNVGEDELKDRISVYLAANYSENTQRAYLQAWMQFVAYCKVSQKDFLPADVLTVMQYLAALTGINKPSTIEVHLAAINAAHKLQKIASPTEEDDVKNLMVGIKSKEGAKQKQALPIKIELLESVIEAYETANPDKLNTYQWKQHKAMLLLAFWGCYREMELINTQAGDLKFEEAWLSVFLPDSKTDKYMEGKHKEIPMRREKPQLCPYVAVLNWLTFAGIEEGAVFRSVNRYDKLNPRKPLAARALNYVVRKYFGNVYSAHSLRVGFAVSAREAGVRLEDIQKAGNWDDLNTVLRYTDKVDLRANNAAKKMFEIYGK